MVTGYHWNRRYVRTLTKTAGSFIFIVDHDTMTYFRPWIKWLVYVWFKTFKSTRYIQPTFKGIKNINADISYYGSCLIIWSDISRYGTEWNKTCLHLFQFSGYQIIKSTNMCLCCSHINHVQHNIYFYLRIWFNDTYHNKLVEQFIIFEYNDAIYECASMIKGKF